MKATTKAAKSKTQEIRQLSPADEMLTEDDVKLLEQLEQAKRKVKKLQDHLKPRITATITAHGTGRLMIGRRQVELKQSTRHSVAWKPLCYSLNEEAAILQVLDCFTEPYNIDQAKVVV